MNFEKNIRSLRILDKLKDKVVTCYSVLLKVLGEVTLLKYDFENELTDSYAEKLNFTAVF